MRCQTKVNRETPFLILDSCQETFILLKFNHNRNFEADFNTSQSRIKVPLSCQYLPTVSSFISQLNASLTLFVLLELQGDH